MAKICKHGLVVELSALFLRE